ncbi:MAG: hypothetical protein GEU80_16640 [Dehalococcoidia bacterium]|nr:hypothetical protein [Dehalococcoidia bacterium]
MGLTVDPMLLLIGFSFAAATALAVVYTYQRVTETQRVARARVIRRGDAGGLGVLSALRSQRSSLPLVDALPLNADARERMEWELDRAGVPLRVSEYLAVPSPSPSAAWCWASRSAAASACRHRSACWRRSRCCSSAG